MFYYSTAGAFTRGDIEKGLILYQHLGSEANSDSFGLVVSDGMHKIPILVHITVQPIDDEQPIIVPLNTTHLSGIGGRWMVSDDRCTFTLRMSNKNSVYRWLWKIINFTILTFWNLRFFSLDY